VLLAGWTTANPTLYRAGLALQTITGWPRWKITLLAGAVTSVLSCFPLFFMKLLDYVAIYGLVLMPVGAVVFTEHWIFTRLGITRYQAEKKKIAFNWKVLVVWAGSLAFAFALPVHLYFRWLPAYIFAILFYVGLNLPLRNKGRAEEIAAEAGAKA
jgi:purine-cytosine permease-like protein